MKRQKNIFLPFVKGSSCSKRPYQSKRLNARLSRKKMSGYISFLKRVLHFLLLSLKITACSVLILPVLIFAEDFYKSFLQIEDFIIKDIAVEGNYFVSVKDILSTAHLSKGDNLIAVNLQEIAKDIEGLNVVKDVRVKKIFPGKLTISITERDPVFASGERKYLLDEEGVKLPFERESFNVPEVFGLSYKRNGDIESSQQQTYMKVVEAVRKFYSMGDELSSTIHAVTLQNKKYMTVTFQDEVQVKLPFEFHEEHFKRLVFVYNDLRGKDVPFDMIDLTFNNVVVKKKKISKHL